MEDTAAEDHQRRAGRNDGRLEVGASRAKFPSHMGEKSCAGASSVTTTETSASQARVGSEEAATLSR